MRYPTSPQEFDTQYPGYKSGVKVTLSRQGLKTQVFFVPSRGEAIQNLMAHWVYINSYRAVVESFDV